MQRIRILHIHDILILGGIPASMLAIAQRLKQFGIDSDFYFRKADVPCAANTYRREFNVFTAEDLPLRMIIGSGQYDIIRTTIWAMYFAIPAINSTGFEGPLVLSTHQAFPTDPIHSRVDEIIAVSHSSAQTVTNPYKKRISVVHDGVDTKMFHPPNSKDIKENPLLPNKFITRPIVLWIGRVNDWRKGFKLFIAVATAMRNRSFNFWAVHSDDCHFSDVLCRSLGGHLTMTAGVKFEEIPEVFRTVVKSGGCLLLTSATESCPNAVLQALASGCPVVAARVGGVSELVENKKTSLLFELGVDLDHITYLIEKACEPDNWQELSSNGRQQALDKFDLSKIATIYANYLRRIEQDYKYRHPLTLRQRSVRLYIPLRRRLNRMFGLKQGWV